MEEKKITPAHDDVRKLIEVIHYEDHDKRTESAEFRKIKHELKAAGCKCYIGNGYCEGNIEIHHSIIEYSASTEVDWQRVQQDHGFDHVDSKVQMMPICEKHHRGVGTGIHSVTYPAWILQKYLSPEALALFEAAVQHLKDLKHEDQHVNYAAKKMLLHVSKINNQ